MSERNPKKHHEFFSHDNLMKLSIPLVINEHEMTGVTIFVLETVSSSNPMSKVEISASGPLILKEQGSGNELHSLSTNIAVPGNNAFHIQSPREHDYPSGKEGECCAQANVIVRKYENIDGKNVCCDSLSVDLYIKRKLFNAFTAIWRTTEGKAVNISGAAIITAIVAITTYFIGQDVAKLVPHFVVVFLFCILAVSVLYSYWTRDRLIMERLESNVHWINLWRDRRG